MGLFEGLPVSAVGFIIGAFSGICAGLLFVALFILKNDWKK
jgi:hypothetical protein